MSQIECRYIDGSDITSIVNEAVNNTTTLITTGIDNDDAFEGDALAIIRERACQTRADFFLNFRFVYLNEGKLTEVFSQKYNPFISLIGNCSSLIEPDTLIFGKYCLLLECL